jgi:propionyl-CoA carboxylase beta chain
MSALAPQAQEREVRSYEEAFNSPMAAARHGFIDDVILPRQTRQRLCAELALLQDKAAPRPHRKHGNLPL